MALRVPFFFWAFKHMPIFSWAIWELFGFVSKQGNPMCGSCWFQITSMGTLRGRAENIPGPLKAKEEAVLSPSVAATGGARLAHHGLPDAGGILASPGSCEVGKPKQRAGLTTNSGCWAWLWRDSHFETYPYATCFRVPPFLGCPQNGQAQKIYQHKKKERHTYGCA